MLTTPEKTMQYVAALKEGGFEYIEEVAETATSVLLQHLYMLLTNTYPDDEGLKQAYAKIQTMYARVIEALEPADSAVEALIPLLVAQMDVFQTADASRTEEIAKNEGAAE